MRYIFLDTDPGIDDAIAIFALLGSPDVTTVGMSVVGGNVGLDTTLKNARCLLDLTGRTDIPLYAGAKQPLVFPLETAEGVHGAGGLGNVTLPDPVKEIEPQDAAEGIYMAAKKYKGEITLMAIGPLTNVAKALLAYPDLKDLLKEIYIMGGAIVGGNTPNNQGEFNIMVDPEAARIVFESGIKLTMAPLEIANDTPISADELRALAGGKVGDIASKIGLDGVEVSERHGHEGGWPVYDAVAIISYLRPDLFTFKDFNVVIETKGAKTRGRTVVDWYGFSGRTPNCTIPLTADREGYVKVLTENIARLG